MARGSILDASKNLSDANSVLSKINDLFDAEGDHPEIWGIMPL
jgi:hypothetical protein